MSPPGARAGAAGPATERTARPGTSGTTVRPGRTVSAGYFREGVWASSGPLRLVRLTCVVCGHRSPSWEAFRAHRVTCREQPEGEPGGETGMTFLGVPTDLLVYGIVLSACVCGALIAVGVLACVVTAADRAERDDGRWR